MISSTGAGRRTYDILPRKIKFLTRGPRGPWVAHLRKRSKATVDPIIENINGGDVQRQNVVNNVDKSSLWAP